MRYSTHARKRMIDRTVTEAEALAILANPGRGTFAPPGRDVIEHFGNLADGRPINVVTNRARTLVITIIVQ